MTAVDRMLADARRTLARVGPAEARALGDAGGLLVDIRPEAQRAESGLIPGAVVIERNVLEWRLDPAGSHRIPEAGDPDRPVVVVCQAGFASSLAAAGLQRLGLRRATDLVGGFEAWRDAGLPVEHAGSRPAGTAHRPVG